jgi:hypothetical protein
VLGKITIFNEVSFIKTLLLNVLTPSGIITFDNLEQPVNIFADKTLIFLEIYTFVNFEQPLNEPVPTDITESGIMILSTPEPSKQYWPKDVTVLGIITFDNLEH